MAIALDIDGPLLDQRLVVDGFARYLQQAVGRLLNMDILAITGDWEKATGIMKTDLDQIYADYLASAFHPKFSIPTPGAREALQQLGHLDRYVVTSRSSQVAASTMQLLTTHFGDFVAASFGNCNRKEKAFSDWPEVKVFVEDSLREAQAVANHCSGIQVFLFPFHGREGYTPNGRLTVLRAERLVRRDMSEADWAAVQRQAWEEIVEFVSHLLT